MAETNQTPGDQEPKSSKTPLVIGLIIVLLIVGYALVKRNSGQPTDEQDTSITDDPSHDSMDIPTPAPTPDEASSSTPTSTPVSPSPATSGEIKTFTVKGQNYSFSPGEIKVKKGDKVKIVFENSGGFHDLTLDEFNVKTPTLPSGKSASIEFTADKTGTFEYYCSVANHRQMGMIGKFIVE